MTNDEILMTKECPNDECGENNRRLLQHSSLGLGASFVIRISSLVILSLLCGCAGPHNASPHLVGGISGNTYTSAQGKFSVPVPVSPEVGGRAVRDDAQSVTFHDDWGSKISFYSRPIAAQSQMMSVLKTQGQEKALQTLANDIYGDSIVPHYHPDVRNGTI